MQLDVPPVKWSHRLGKTDNVCVLVARDEHHSCLAFTRDGHELKEPRKGNMVVERQQVGRSKPFIEHRIQVIGEITRCSMGLIKKRNNDGQSSSSKTSPFPP